MGLFTGLTGGQRDRERELITVRPLARKAVVSGWKLESPRPLGQRVGDVLGFLKPVGLPTRSRGGRAPGSRTPKPMVWPLSKALELRIEEDQGAPRLVAAGELDLATAAELEAGLKQLESGAPAVLVLDLRELEFMDSTGLRTVIAADARARERGARLVVVRAPEEVDRVFRLTRMDQHLDLVDEPPNAG